MDEDHDPMAELERLDRFLGGEEDGDRPLDVLRRNGISIPHEQELDDVALHAKLWEILHGMAAISMVVESTDHLSDRELYRWLVTDALCEETFLPMPGSGGAWHTSPIGGCSEEDNEIYPTPTTTPANAGTAISGRRFRRKRRRHTTGIGCCRCGRGWTGRRCSEGEGHDAKSVRWRRMR